MKFLNRLFSRPQEQPGSDIVQPPQETRAAPADAEEAEGGIADDGSTVTFLPDGSMRVTATTVDEAKIGIKQLRLHKRGLTAQKRELTAQIQAIRAEHRSRVAGRHVLPRGGGRLGQITRVGIQIKRRAERMQADNAVVPLERQRAALEEQLIEVDRGIAQLEAYVLRNK
ncbi:MAG: hypothetical protein LC798_21060 [Chloroflexi bacterium]|nr:hypothetical protein [Chloroflexota bacterium]